MKWNLVIIFLVAVMASLGTVYWKVDRDFYRQKTQWNEAQSRAQISAIAHSLETEIEGLVQVLDLAYPIISEMKLDYADDQVFSKFQMISRVQKNESGDFVLQNKFFLQKSSVRAWGANYAYFALKNLKDTNFESAQIHAIHDPQRKPWLLLVVRSRITQNLYAAILSKDFFQTAVERQKGQLSRVSIVNQQGQVIAHSVAEYIGMDLREDDMIKEIISSSRQSGSGYFKGLEGENNHGFYNRSEKVDLYVTVSTSVADLMSERAGLKKKFVFLGIGIIFVGLAFLFFMETGIRKEESSFNPDVEVRTAKPVATAAPQSPPPSPLPTSPPKVVSPVASKRQPEKTNQGFEQLFGQRKIEEAFDMIDNLDSPPRNLQSVESTGEAKTVIAAAPPFHASPPPPPPPPPPAAFAPPTPPPPPAAPVAVAIVPTPVAPVEETPLVQIRRRVAKLDDFVVRIRRPGERL